MNFLMDKSERTDSFSTAATERDFRKEVVFGRLEI